MINLIYKINEIPTPPAAPPNFSFMSSIQIVPALAHRRRRKLLTFASLTVLLEMNFLNFFWRVEAFDAALTEDVINDSNLRQLCFAGVPEGKGRRALAWRLLLNFLPMERGTWKDFLHQQRQLYAQLIGMIFSVSILYSIYLCRFLKIKTKAF